jgi:hypothetical protein
MTFRRILVAVTELPKNDGDRFPSFILIAGKSGIVL